MGDVSVQHVDREIVGGVASTVLGHEREIPRAVEARAREDLARNPQMGSGENETHEERSRYTAKGRPHPIARDCSLCCYAAWVEPAKTSTLLTRFRRGHGVFLLAPALRCRSRSHGEDLFDRM
jgi:hypothetical protein